MANSDKSRGHAYFASLVLDSMAVDCLAKPTADRRYFALQPIDAADVRSTRDQGINVCVVMQSEEGEIGLAKYLSVFEENKQLRVQVERLKDSLLQLNQELARAVARPSE